MNVGILALQGNFERHRQRLKELGAGSFLVKKKSELRAIDGLIIPGGESTTLLTLTDVEFRQEMRTQICSGLPTLATCAGLILLANRVFSPAQESLGVLDIDVERNAYGRQVDSFIESHLSWTETGRAICARLPNTQLETQLEGVFIRAPKISRVGENIQVLAAHRGDPVFIQQQHILGACFHPELSTCSHAVHLLFLEFVRSSLKLPRSIPEGVPYQRQSNETCKEDYVCCR